MRANTLEGKGFFWTQDLDKLKGHWTAAGLLNLAWNKKKKLICFRRDSAAREIKNIVTIKLFIYFPHRFLPSTCLF